MEPKKTNPLIPILMGTITLLFVALVAFRLLQADPAPAPAQVPAASVAKSTDDLPEHPEVEVAHIPDEKSRFEKLIAGSGIDRDLAEEARVRAKLKEMFEKIHITQEDFTNAYDYQDNRQALEDYLASLPPEMVPLLMELLEEEKYFVSRYILIRALGEIGSDLAADALIARFDYALEVGKAKEVERTMEALGLVDSAYSFDALHDLLDRDDEGALRNRTRFVMELGNHSMNKQAVPTFLSIARESGHPRTREASARALKQAADPKSVVEIERLLETERSPYVRQSLMGALGVTGDRNSLRVLENIGRTDDDVSTRASAVQAIYRIGGTEAREALQRLAESEENESNRARAVRQALALEERGF